MASRTGKKTVEKEILMLRSAVKTAAGLLLSKIEPRDFRRARYRTTDGRHDVTIIVSAPGLPHERKAGGGSGLFFSPLDAAIVNAIGADGCLVAKEIAVAIGQRATSKLRTLLRNLVEREILASTTEGQGYSWSDPYRQSRRKPA